ITGFGRGILDLGAGAIGQGTVIPVGDFDGDGRDDFLVHVASNTVSYGSLTVYRSNGTSFDPPVSWSTGLIAPDASSFATYIGDFDGL
ncbi:MAG: VCBS repeat-containing protein, partial [Myxococcales bacterium]|nr:VCBS repeat-containing protein [Myxococcales bacterium]